MHQFELDQLPFPCKIDYYSGAQGNFLQLMLALNTNPSMINLDNLFDENGACHTIYHSDKQPQWQTQIGTAHFSQLGLPMQASDRVVEIHVPKNYYQIVLINYLLRAPDQPFDIMTPHVDTIRKLDEDPRKMSSFKEKLQRFFGPGPHYDLWHWRLLFYNEFLKPDAERNQFRHTGEKYFMEFDCFFDFHAFRSNLKNISLFLRLPFQYNEATEMAWQNYMGRNQGYAAKLKCDQIYKDLIDGRSVDLSDLDAVSQGWIIYRCFTRSPHLAMAWIKNFPSRSDCATVTLNDQMISESTWLELPRW